MESEQRSEGQEASQEWERPDPKTAAAARREQRKILRAGWRAAREVQS